jgi:transposase
VNTIEEEAPLGRRRRRRYSVEFKAQVVAACQGPGVSLAAIALHHKLNANLLRRWVEQAERNDCVLVARSDVAAPSAMAPTPALCRCRSRRQTRVRLRFASKFVAQISRLRLAGRHQKQRNVLSGCESGSRDPH